MKPKDLLKHLEKGNRTMEMLKPRVNIEEPNETFLRTYMQNYQRMANAAAQQILQRPWATVTSTNVASLQNATNQQANLQSDGTIPVDRLYGASPFRSPYRLRGVDFD